LKKQKQYLKKETDKKMKLLKTAKRIVSVIMASAMMLAVVPLFVRAEKKDPETTEKPAVLPESTAAEEDEFKTKEAWLSAKDAPGTFFTIEEAALQSGISPQAISRYVMRGHFGECRKIGGKVRIPGKHFQEWMKKRQEGEMAHGFD
jgi:hypothetical protein